MQALYGGSETTKENYNWKLRTAIRTMSYTKLTDSFDRIQVKASHVCDDLELLCMHLCLCF